MDCSMLRGALQMNHEQISAESPSLIVELESGIEFQTVRTWDRKTE